MEQYSILVTGGAGFVGSHLVDALVTRGHDVRALDSLVPQVHPDGKPGYLNPNAEWIWGDIRDAAVLEQALSGVDMVYHQASEVGVGQSMYELQRFVSGNSLATAALLEALVERRGHIRKLIVASSMTVYGEGVYACPEHGTFAPALRPEAQLRERRWEVECSDCGQPADPVPTPEERRLSPTSVYAITKQDQEQLCLLVGRTYAIPTVALRYFNIYGPRQALSNPYTGVAAIFSTRLRNGHAPALYEDGEQSRDFVHVRDVVQANLLALETSRADYRAVNVGTGRGTSVRRMAELIADGLGMPIAPDVLGRYRDGDIRHCTADLSLARELLGYEPRVPLETGIRELPEWVNGQPADDRTSQATRELEMRELVH